MDQGPLVNEQIEAAAEFLRRFEDFAPVRAAFWLRTDDAEPNYLYVAAENIDESKFRSAYDAIWRLTTGDHLDPHLDPFQIKLINPDAPLARAAANMIDRYPARVPVHFRDRELGRTSADEAYIYATPIPAVNL